VAAARCGNRARLFGANITGINMFLLALTDHLQPNGLEHHESSDKPSPEERLHAIRTSWKRRWIAVARIFSFLEREIPAACGACDGPNYQEPMRESCCGFMKD